MQNQNKNIWQDKVVLVTGGSSGLGYMIANGFATKGAMVVIAALEEGTAEKAATEIQQLGYKAFGIQANVTRQEDVDKLFSTIESKFGGLDVLVNNAGRSVRGKISETTPDHFKELMELNFFAVVRCTLAALPLLLKSKGSIINIGSLASKASARWVAGYPATKFAVAAYSQQLRLELGEEGLHVLLVCPGPIKRDTPRLYEHKGVEGLPESARKPGAGVKTKGIPPEKLVEAIISATEKRKYELIMPRKAKILFVLAQICPKLGDWIVLKMT